MAEEPSDVALTSATDHLTADSTQQDVGSKGSSLTEVEASTAEAASVRTLTRSRIIPSLPDYTGPYDGKCNMHEHSDDAYSLERSWND